MSDEESLRSSSASDSEPETSDLQLYERDKTFDPSARSSKLTNQDVALMLDMDTSMSESDLSAKESRNGQRKHRSANNQSQDSSPCTENLSPFLVSRLNNTSSPSNRDLSNGYESGRNHSEYDDSNSTSSASLPDTRLAGSTPTSSRSSGKRFENRINRSDETTPTRRSLPSLSLRSGHVELASAGSRGGTELAGSTPTMSRSGHRSATGEVVDDHNHPNDENAYNTTEKNSGSPLGLLTVNPESSINPTSAFDSVESGSVCKALQEISGLINSVAKRMDDIEGKLSEKTNSEAPRKKIHKEKVPLSVKVRYRYSQLY